LTELEKSYKIAGRNSAAVRGVYPVTIEISGKVFVAEKKGRLPEVSSDRRLYDAASARVVAVGAGVWEVGEGTPTAVPGLPERRGGLPLIRLPYPMRQRSARCMVVMGLGHRPRRLGQQILQKKDLVL